MQATVPPIIYQDDSILVFDKPANLVVTTAETQSAISLEEILKNQLHINLDRGGIVHRLDKDTSGLIVVAKTAAALESLQTQFRERQVNKEYLALVHGYLEKEGKVDIPIGRNPGDREKFTVFSGSVPEGANVRSAVTIYKPIKLYKIPDESLQQLFADYSKIQWRKLERSNYNRFTLVSCHPLTGRTHQIRVHLKYLGFSIVGDGKYGGRKTARLDHRFCHRQFLHAAKLEFDHQGKREKFESKLPEDLAKVLEMMVEK